MVPRKLQCMICEYYVPSWSITEDVLNSSNVGFVGFLSDVEYSLDFGSLLGKTINMKGKRVCWEVGSESNTEEFE